MDQSVFANIQIAAAGATVPFIRQPLHQIPLESPVLGEGKHGRSHSKDIFINPFVLRVERLQLTVMAVEDAYGCGESNFACPPGNNQGVGRVSYALPYHGIDANLKISIFGKHPQLWFQRIQALL
jgi:hypothetical protein